MDNHTNKISLVSISKSFMVDGYRQHVLQDITFSVNIGESIAITGVSGAGKSTLLAIMAGLDEPTTGDVYYNDQKIYALGESDRAKILRTDIGVLFQDSYLLDNLTVQENIMLKGLVAGQKKEQLEDSAQELLSLVGLIQKRDAYPRTLSGGQRQRVALMRALFNAPKFLFADEPTGNLDKENAHLIIDLLLSFSVQYKMGLIISSHDPLVVQKVERLFQVSDGRLL